MDDDGATATVEQVTAAGGGLSNSRLARAVVRSLVTLAGLLDINRV